ncbi:hypothetical protein D3C87_2169120 [compost metagenome]
MPRPVLDQLRKQFIDVRRPEPCEGERGIELHEVFEINPVVAFSPRPIARERWLIGAFDNFACDL